METRPLTVSVVIPSLRPRPELFELLERLRTEPPSAELLVADNGLPESAVARLEAGGACVLPMGRNRGFGAAVNNAAGIAAGDCLVVLNDDVLPEPGFLQELVEPLAEGKAMAAGVLLQKDRPGVIETAGIELDRTLGAHDHLRDEPVASLDDGVPPPVAPSGAAAAYLRAAFLEAGGFDENLFAYYEDVDLGLRLRSLGARCGLATGARAVHTGSGTLGYRSLVKAELVGRSRGYLLRKYGVLTRPGSVLPALALEISASLALGVRHGSLRPLQARIQGWRGCRIREEWPDSGALGVGLLSGARRRYSRSAPAPAAIAGFGRAS